MTLHSRAKQHRAAILAKDVQLADQIARKYHPIWYREVARLQKLLKDMQSAEQAALDSNLPFNRTIWLVQFQRLDTLLSAVNDDIGSFARTAHDLVQQQLDQAWHAGAQDSLDLLGSQVQGVFGVPNPDAIDVLMQRRLAEDDVVRLFSKMSLEESDLIRKRLLAGVASGQGPRTIAADIARSLNIPLNRALTIARTESIGAYRDAALATYRANSDVVSGWTWSAAAGACPFCQSMDGTHHTLDETMDSHPNCRCTMLPDVVSSDHILAEAA